MYLKRKAYDELTALNRIDQYEKMSLCGGSNAEIYRELQALYNDYCMIGGYPGGVLKYLENTPLQECQAELLKIIRLFTNESMRKTYWMLLFTKICSLVLHAFWLKRRKASIKKKADYVLYAKGNTCGGTADNTITIPIYGISKFKF